MASSSREAWILQESADTEEGGLAEALATDCDSLMLLKEPESGHSKGCC